MEPTPQPRVVQIGPVRVEVTASAGFCFGVDLAVQKTGELLDAGKKVVTFGPLIHNPTVIAQLEERGATVANTPQDIAPDATVVIRSHGVAPAVRAVLDKTAAQVVDATCPYVKKIHKIAQKCGADGATLIVIGNPDHPEVQGVVGCTSGPVVVARGVEELQNAWPGVNADAPVCMVAQTTYDVAGWAQCVDFLKKVCTNCGIFDTICSATWTRQHEVQAIARRCDLVLVVGGRGSSNTAKLLQIAQQHTRAVQIETAADLADFAWDGVRSVGITAGASTPVSVIEEVLTSMSDDIRAQEMSFEEMLEESMKPVYAGQIVKGVVEAVSANEVTVDIGIKQTGIIKLEELTDDPAVRSAEDLVKRGDELELVVVSVNDSDGLVLLSKKQLEARKGAEEVAQAAEDGTIMDGYVVESNKGGLVAIVKGVKVFIPASQATARRGEDYTKLVRTHQKLKIKEFSSRRVIGSIREVLGEEQAAKREAFWSDVEIGKTYVGTVKSLTSYGAFVDIGGVDGLVHISELSWNRIKHPSEVVNVGDTIEVYVKDIDREKQKVSLGFKKTEDDPWRKLKEEYPIGSVFTAPVVSITQFGAFVRILPGVDGLVHISEISHDHVERVADVLQVGQEVEVKLIDVDYDRHRISLSMKALQEAPEKQAKSGDDEMVASSSADETVVAPAMAAEIDETVEEAPQPEAVAEEAAEAQEEPAPAE